MSDSRTIAQILKEDHYFDLVKCPRYSSHRGLLKDGVALGCVTASDAVNFIRNGRMLPCMCKLRNSDGEGT